jgi:hypothetical protein
MNIEYKGSMKIEDDIHAALTMLGETHPPEALVSRTRQRLEIAAMSQRARSSRRFLIPAAGVAMAAVALVAIFTQMHRTRENQGSAVQAARLVANTPLAQAAMMPPSATAETERSAEGKRLVQHSTKRRSRRNRESRHAINLLSYPLTRQEKLLLQFAHHAKPADLQVLNPEYQAKVEAQQDAEFAAYLKSMDSSGTQETAN